MKPLFFSKHLRVLSYRLSSILQDRRAVRPSGLRAEDCRKPSTEAREHRNRQNRLRFVLSVLLASMVSSGSVLAERSPQAVPPSCQHVNVPPADAATAITELARQTGAKLLFPYKLAKAQQARPVIGCFSLQQALALLLDGTQLASGLSDKGVLTIAPAGSDVFVTKRHNNGEETMKKNMRKNVLAAVVGVFAAGSGGVFGQEGSEDSLDWLLEEVVVTATKRGAGTSIQDTAMAISALGADTIEKRGLVGMNDYLSTLPGVSMQERGVSQNNVIIRGMGADPIAEAPTVSIYFGEVPITGLGGVSSSDPSGSLDMKLVDIERIEVLRGPQGTLYGSGSMGGTVRQIPKAPNLQDLEGSLRARYSITGEKGDDNNMIQGVINVPVLEDVLALRAAAYRFERSGFYEDVGISDPAALATAAEVIESMPFGANPLGFGANPSGGDNIGSSEHLGFRIGALWQASENLSLNLNYAYQKIEQDGFPEEEQALSDFEQVRFAGPNGEDESLGNEVDILNLVVNYDFDWGTVTSSTSKVIYEASTEQDSTNLFLIPLFADNRDDREVLTEELRLSTNLDGPFQFVAGLYYEKNELVRDVDWAWSGDPNSFLAGTALFSDFEKEGSQKAVFGELSYTISDSLVATVGARHFEFEDNLKQNSSFAVEPIDEDGDEKDQTYKVNLSYTPTEDDLLYIQWAEGFRLGTVQAADTVLALCDANNDGLLDDTGEPAPSRLNSDFVDSYEIGFKTTLNNGGISVNAAVYRNNWDGIPVGLFMPSCGQFIQLNAGEAVSEGVELEVQARLSDDLNLSFSTAYGESELSKDHDLLGDKGASLPGSSDFNASLGLEYRFSLAEHPAFARLDYSYVSGFFGNIAKSGPEAGDFDQIHLKFGLNIDDIDLDLFINNLTNADEITAVGSTNIRFSRLRPRTIGFNIAYNF